MRLLAVLVNYGTEQLDYLKQVVSELQSFKDYEVKIIINTNVQTGIPGVFDVVHKLGNNQLLPLACRKTIWDNREKFDVFYYGENDHLLKEHHVDNFRRYTEILPENRIAGLFQYEETGTEEGKWFPAGHARYHWDVTSVEEHGGLKFAHFTNLHQASFLLTQKQLKSIGEKYDFTKFFEPSHYSQKCKVNTDIYQFGGMKKMICISEFFKNIIHHLPNHYATGAAGRHKLGTNEINMRNHINRLIYATGTDLNKDKSFLIKKYEELCATRSDINEHLPTLKEYAEQCNHVTELGVRKIVSTWALLAGKPRVIRSYDIRHPNKFGANLEEVEAAASLFDIDFKFTEADVLEIEIEETELLFIDTWHVYKQLAAELKLHAEKATKYIILHDTVTFGQIGENGGDGLNRALNEFLDGNLLWSIEKQFTNNNGLTVLKRGVIANKKVIYTATPEESFYPDSENMIDHLKSNLKPINKPDMKVVKGGDGDLKEEKYAAVLEINKPVQKKPQPHPRKTVRFIIPFPDVKYYIWQVLVQINNFKKMGYDVQTDYLCCYFNGKPSREVYEIAMSKDHKARFFFYPDTRPQHFKQYTASIKNWLMAQFFTEWPGNGNFTYVYLDPDLIFLEKINFDQFTDDDVWYESDSTTYLNTTYIEKKGDGLLDEMCKIVGIHPQLVKFNDSDSGGAQYVIKNNTAGLWHEICETGVRLYDMFVKAEQSGRFKPKDGVVIQKWSAEMWATNWVLWKRGIKTKVTPELHFHWADHLMKDKRHKMLHVTGITDSNNVKGLHFDRVKHQVSPFNTVLKASPQSISYLYTREIKETEQNFKDLIWLPPENKKK